VKAIWLDIDVGKPNGYQTVEEALKAAITFCEDGRAPAFQRHRRLWRRHPVYWISDKMLTPEDCDDMPTVSRRSPRGGLKCDLGVTTDVAPHTPHAWHLQPQAG